MKILFYSNDCKYSTELLSKIKESNLYDEFNLVNIKEADIPSKIKMVPTIIDSDYKELLEGKKAFEYVFNKKYFNNKTNNLYSWLNKDILKPKIDENEMALSTDILNESTDNIEKSTCKYELIDNKKEENQDEKTSKQNDKKTIKLNSNSILRLRSRQKL
tara:strand:+ start:637 stop:1116 length:480 start_codon:yes stop_codon:yes gene_type:complete